MSYYFIQTWGCQMNEYDSNRIRDLLVQNNYKETTDITQADVVLLVTCAIREKAQEKIFNQLFSWKAQNQYKENAVVCVGGCVASQEGKNVITRAPMVSVVFGPQTIHRVPDMINKYLETGEKQVDLLLEDSAHYALFQESLMKVLNFCEMPMGETYSVIKAISKKNEACRDVWIINAKQCTKANLETIWFYQT